MLGKKDHVVGTRSISLNVGSGEQGYGDVRTDFEPSPTTTFVCDATRGLPFKDNVFSLVHSRCLFGHRRNPGLFLDEAFRALPEDGELMLTTDHAGYWRWLFQIDHASHSTHRSSGDRHYALFSPGHLRNFCEASGFRVISMDYDDFEPHARLAKDPVLRLLPRLLVLSRPRLRVIARKPGTRTRR